MTYFKRFVLLALLILTPLYGCELGRESEEVDFITIVTPSEQMIFAEVALTPEQQSQGLMFREQLDEDKGMLFIFEQERPLSFWMKNTLIPLDVIYLNADTAIVNIQTMVPCPEEEERCPSYPSQAPVQYALELNAGMAEKFGLKVGDVLSIPLDE